MFPELSISVAQLPTPGAAQSTTTSDYTSSDLDFQGGSVNPGGSASWQVNLLSGTRDRVAVCGAHVCCKRHAE